MAKARLFFSSIILSVLCLAVVKTSHAGGGFFSVLMSNRIQKVNVQNYSPSSSKVYVDADKLALATAIDSKQKEIADKFNTDLGTVQDAWFQYLSDFDPRKENPLTQNVLDFIIATKKNGGDNLNEVIVPTIKRCNAAAHQNLIRFLSSTTIDDIRYYWVIFAGDDVSSMDFFITYGLKNSLLEAFQILNIDASALTSQDSNKLSGSFAAAITDSIASSLRLNQPRNPNPSFFNSLAIENLELSLQLERIFSNVTFKDHEGKFISIFNFYGNTMTLTDPNDNHFSRGGPVRNIGL